MLAPGTVVDADPRTISNLIADQTLNNPAAISAALTYAGITGAAQMTAISQIQAARVAITNAVQTSNTTSGGIPALVTAKAEAQTAATTASNEATNAQAAADAAQAALATANEEKAAAQLVVTETFNAFNALLLDDISTDRPAGGIRRGSQRLRIGPGNPERQGGHSRCARNAGTECRDCRADGRDACG